jgi:hypothetical protein
MFIHLFPIKFIKTNRRQRAVKSPIISWLYLIIFTIEIASLLNEYFIKCNSVIFILLNHRFKVVSITYKKSLKIPKGVIRIRISKKDIQHNGQKTEEQTTQWPKEKEQKDKQRSTKHTHKTKDRVIQTPLNSGGELRCSGRASSSCSTGDTCRVNLVTNPVISLERGKNWEVFTSGTYPWSLVTQIFQCGQQSHGDDRKAFEVMTSS